MGKHGSTNPHGMVTKSARDPSQPTQEQIDHTEQMNRWFAESFNNLFQTKLDMIAESVSDSDAKFANEILRRVYADIASMKADVHFLKMLLASHDVKPEDVAAKFLEVRKSIIASYDYTLTTYGERDAESDAEFKAKFEATEPINFTFNLHPETPAALEANTIEAARARNLAGWRNLVRRWFKPDE